jgi:hypothetical protein
MRPTGGFLPFRADVFARSARPVLTHWTHDNGATWLLHNARSALHALWAAERPSRVWLPAYLCQEVATSVPAGIAVQFYPMTPSLSPRTDVIAAHAKSGEHVLAVNYFGRPPQADFIALTRSRPDIGWIEDRAHTLDAAESAWGDWLLYSPRKLFGVPDGGILVPWRKPLPPLTTSPCNDLSFVLPCLERFEDRDETENVRWYGAYRQTEAGMQPGTAAMTRLSLQALQACDATVDGDMRRRNYDALYGTLHEFAFIEESPISFSPMGFPLRTGSAQRLADRLASSRIFAARHWRELPSEAALFPDEHRLASELLTLPCDYRYDESDMRRMADAVLAAIAEIE